MRRLLLLGMLLFVLILPAVSAQYTISGPQSVAISSCDYGVYTLELTNTGLDAIKPTLDVQSGSPVADWIVFDPKSPLLAPGETAQITVLIRVPCRQQGTFKFNFFISGVEQPSILPQTLIVTRTSNILAASLTPPLTSCPCLPQVFRYTVDNIAPHADVFRITATGDTKYVAVAQQREILFPGERFEGVAFVNAPCDVAGTIDFSIVVESEIAGFIATIPFSYTVDACYDYELAVPERIQACLDGETPSNLTLTNQMHFQNAYTVEVSPRWVVPQVSQIDLLANQTGIVPLTLSPVSGKKGQMLGEYSLNVRATSTLGNARITHAVPVDVVACYDYTLQGPEYIMMCDQHTTVVPFTLSNNGLFDEEYTFSLEGPQFLSLSSATAVVPSGTSQEILLVGDVHNSSDMIYDARIIATSAHANVAPAILPFKVHTVSVEECYAVRVSPTKMTLLDNEQNHTITITHVGFRPANYSLSLVGQEWIGIALDTPVIELQPKQAITIVLSTTIDDIAQTYWSSLQVAPATVEGLEYVTTLQFSPESHLLTILLLLGLVLLLLLILLLLIYLWRKMHSKKSSSETSSNARRAKEMAAQAAKEKKALEKKRRAEEERQSRKSSRLSSRLSSKKTGMIMEEKSGRADKTTAAKNGRTAGWWITLLALLLIILILFFVPPERLFPGDNQANITNETNMTDGIDRNISIEGMNITDTTVQPVDMEEMYGGGFINLSNITIAIDPMALSPLTQRQVDVLLLQRQLDAIPEELRNTLLYQIITEGNQTTIDLNEYFIDPDDDALYFTTFSIPNISVTLDGSVATLTPDPSFIGLRYTVFFARDDAGAYAQSPVVNIIVVPQNITAESQTILEQYGDLPEIEQLFAEQYPGVFVDSAKEEQDRQRDRFWFMFSAFGLIVLIIIMAFILRQMQKN